MGDPAFMMKRTPLLALALMGPMTGCSSPEPTVTSGPGALPGTPFEYFLSFIPQDSVYGASGSVSGNGAAWTLGASGAFQLELPAAQVGSTPFGGTRLDLVLRVFTPIPGNLPDTGRYELAFDPAKSDGQAWLRDPTRSWTTVSPGIFIIERWHADGTVDGRLAFRVREESLGDVGGLLAQEVSLVGTFSAKQFVRP